MQASRVTLLPTLTLNKSAHYSLSPKLIRKSQLLILPRIPQIPWSSHLPTPSRFSHCVWVLVASFCMPVRVWTCLLQILKQGARNENTDFSWLCYYLLCGKEPLLRQLHVFASLLSLAQNMVLMPAFFFFLPIFLQIYILKFIKYAQISVNQYK